MHIKNLTLIALILIPVAGIGRASAQAPAQDQPKAEKPYFKQVREGLPKTPADRARVLSNLYAHLTAAPDAQTASMITDTIEQVWSLSYSDTVAVLMDRSVKAMAEKNNDLALKLLDAVVDLAPDYAEGWNRRAIVHYANNDYMRALGDLRRVLALDPNHYKALDGLAQILRELDRDKQALQAYRQLLSINPYWPGAGDAVKELEREVEGQGI